MPSERLEKISELLLTYTPNYNIYTIGPYSNITYLSKEDYLWAKEYTWYNSSSGYVYRSFINKKIYLHREIFERQGLNLKGLEIDHKDHNPLNNIRENIRIATISQNRANSRFNRRRIKTTRI